MGANCAAEKQKSSRHIKEKNEEAACRTKVCRAEMIFEPPSAKSKSMTPASKRPHPEEVHAYLVVSYPPHK